MLLGCDTAGDGAEWRTLADAALMLVVSGLPDCDSSSSAISAPTTVWNTKLLLC
jgi:hypothetical protein